MGTTPAVPGTSRTMSRAIIGNVRPSKMEILLLFFALVVTASIRGATATTTSVADDGALPAVTGIAPASGSLAGGTLITIEGVNFDRDLYGTRTKVFVGASDCPLKHFYSSENRVVCTTPPRSIESTENVTLFQNDVEIPGSVAYRYARIDTPEVHSIQPRSVPPEGTLTLAMKYTWFEEKSDSTERKAKRDDVNTLVRAGDYILEHVEREPGPDDKLGAQKRRHSAGQSNGAPSEGAPQAGAVQHHGGVHLHDAPGNKGSHLWRALPHHRPAAGNTLPALCAPQGHRSQPK